MKKILIHFLFFSSAVLMLSSMQESEDLTKCLVKVRHEWSKPCAQCTDYLKSYKVYLRNNCDKKVDVKCAVQEVDLRWRTFMRLQVMPGDTISGYACKGTGKYLYWVRNAGDLSQPFLTDEEINNQFRNR
jgi:hypothetical protein